MTAPRIRTLLLAVAALALGVPAGAQVPEWESRRPMQSRATLEDLLRRLEEAARRQDFTATVRRQAGQEAEVVRARLEHGDFQVGDRILLQVGGEPELSDTFRVAEGPTVVLPMMGPVSLRGVLRSELQPHLTQRLQQVLLAPVVQARSLIRLSVLGEVGSPGFYVLPSEALIEEAIMAAGGPSPDAKLSGLRIERGDSTVWRGDALQQAMVAGRTFDDLDLQAGDRLFVPRRGGIGRAWRFLIAVPAAIYAIQRISR